MKQQPERLPLSTFLEIVWLPLTLAACLFVGLNYDIPRAESFEGSRVACFSDGTPLFDSAANRAHCKRLYMARAK